MAIDTQNGDTSNQGKTEQHDEKALPYSFFHIAPHISRLSSVSKQSLVILDNCVQAQAKPNNHRRNQKRCTDNRIDFNLC